MTDIELNNEAAADEALIAALQTEVDETEDADGVFVNDDGETTQIN